MKTRLFPNYTKPFYVPGQMHFDLIYSVLSHFKRMPSTDYGKLIYQTHFLFWAQSLSNIAQPPSWFAVAKALNVADKMWSGALCASFRADP